MAKKDGRIYHALQHGLPLCNFTRDVPKDWPPGHYWARPEKANLDKINCPACKRATEERLKPSFDPNVGPTHQTNRMAAESRGLRWDARKKYFVDSGGALMRDKFGQPL